MFKNSATTAPAPLEVLSYHLNTAIEDYDVNFVSAIPSQLASNGVFLVPCIPSVHAEYLYNQLRTPENASVYRFLPYGPYDSFDAFLTFLEERRRDPCAVMFVAFDQAMEFGETKGTDPFDSKRIAGLVGLLNSSVEHRKTEIGNIHILPSHQRSHIMTHCASLLLTYAFDTLLLRRVSWYANHLNAPSINCALRLGFAFEGIQRWDRMLPGNKDAGVEIPVGQREVESGEGRGIGIGRHSAVLAIGWDLWSDSGAVKMAALVRREVLPKRMEQ